MPSLRATIGAMTAFIVLAVAATTLSVTLTYSIDALRTIGKTHAEAMLQIASSKTAALLAKPIDAATSVQADAMSFNAKQPSDDLPDWTRALRAHFGIMRAYYPDVDSIFVLYTDGSTSNSQPNLASGNLILYGWLSSNGTMSEPVTDHFYPGNFTAVPPALRASTPPPISYASAFVPPSGLFVPVVNALQGALSNAGLWFPIDSGVLKLEHGGTVNIEYAMRLSKVVRNATHTLGVAIANIGLRQIETFLRASKSTPATEAFVVDDQGYLLGATHATPWVSRDPVPSGTVAPVGCGTTEAIKPAGQNYLACRTHASRHAFAPLRHAFNNTALLKPRGPAAVELMTVEGKTYFAARQVVAPRGTIGLLPVLVLFLPEEDVLGDVTTGRNIAIGISVAVFVVATAIAIVAVSVLLGPLTEVSDRMYAAASLQMDAAPMPKSSMAEVRALQRSFNLLNAQLTKLKSFVPQSVLATLATSSDGGDDDDDDETPCINAEGDFDADLAGEVRSTDSASTRASAHSHTPSKRSKITSKGRNSRGEAYSTRSGASAMPPVAAGALLNMQVGATERFVTVVMLNLRRFHERSAREGVLGMPKAYADYVDTVARVAADNNGVLDSFHGDRVTLTFNAARATLGHARRGVLAALAMASATTALKLPVAAGVASGRALVGNLGADAAKRFCTIGTVVPRAAALTRLAAAYPDEAMAQCAVVKGSRVLVSGRMLEELQATFATRALDYVNLTRDAKAGTCVAEVVRAIDASEGNDEWLYVVARNSKTPPQGGSSDAAVVAGCADVFLALGAAKLEAARTALEAAGRGIVIEPPAVLERARAAVAAAQAAVAEADAAEQTAKALVGRDAGIVW